MMLLNNLCSIYLKRLFQSENNLFNFYSPLMKNILPAINAFWA